MPSIAYRITPDPTNPPKYGFTAANRPYFIFDDSIDQMVILTGIIPSDFSSGFQYIAKYWTSTSTASSVIALRDESMAVADGEDLDTDNFGSVNKSSEETVPGTAGLQDSITTTISGTFAAGDYFAVRIGRENGTSGTNQLGDLNIVEFSLEYTAS